MTGWVRFAMGLYLRVTNVDACNKSVSKWLVGTSSKVSQWDQVLGIVGNIGRRVQSETVANVIAFDTTKGTEGICNEKVSVGVCER